MRICVQKSLWDSLGITVHMNERTAATKNTTHPVMTARAVGRINLRTSSGGRICFPIGDTMSWHRAREREKSETTRANDPSYLTSVNLHMQGRGLPDYCSSQHSSPGTRYRGELRTSFFGPRRCISSAGGSRWGPYSQGRDARRYFDNELASCKERIQVRNASGRKQGKKAIKLNNIFVRRIS